jgi:hypothetical protein
MVRNVHQFRRVKWGDPEHKLKVLSEDLRPRRSWLRPSVPAILTTVFLAGAFGIGFTANQALVSRAWSTVPGSGCNIKGNISQNTGERIYHVPGQRYYATTRISTRHGERWFCSEEEARRAGWRRSRV